MGSVAKKQQKDFFISYTRIDRAWANWVAWKLEEAGYSTVVQTKDFIIGSNFGVGMNKAIQEARYTIAILSPEYLKSPYAQSEWVATFIDDPTGEDRKLLPVRVKEFEHKGLLAGIVYIDFVGLDEVTATKELLEAVKNLHVKRKLTASRLNKGHASLATPSPFPGISSTIWNCPHRQNRYFTGRKEFLEGLRIRFERENLTSQKQPIAISGLAGIGKTQVAVEYAYRYLSKYSFILWAGASSYDMLSAELATIARLLNLYSKDVKEQELAIAALKLYLQEQSNWLLILDAVDDPEVVRALIPLSELPEHGHILITTQNPRIQEIAQKIELEKMPLEEGAFFLRRRAGIITLSAQFDEDSEDALLAKDISFSLDGLPLALDHAGAYIGQTDCGLVAYLKHYQAQAVRPTLMRYVPHPDALSVASTFTISFEKVFTKHNVSAKLLQLCAFLHHDAIPEEIITGGAVIIGRSLGAVLANEVKFDEAIAALRRYSLIHRNPFEKTLTIHGLVQIILKDQMTRSERQGWAEKTVQIVSRTFPEVEHSTWPLCQKYLPHALECAKLITEWDMTFIQAGQLLHRVGQYLLERAQYSQAKLLLTKALEIYEKKLGSEDIQVAAVLDNLGSLYLKQGGQTAYTDAELLYLRSLAILEEKLGPEDPITAQSLNHLGLLYYNQGKYIQAEPRYLKAKAIEERVRENYAADLAVTLNNLAWLYYNLGRFDEVRPLLEEALAIQERPEGSESPAMATTLNVLAMYYRSKGNDIEAKKIFKRALAIRVRIFGHKHPDVATTLNDLAWLFRTLGEFEQAEEHYQQALLIREQTLGPSHPHVATTKSDIATLTMDQGKYLAAEKLYNEVLIIREKTLGPQHPNLATILYSIGWLYFHQGKYAQAESSHKRALEIQKKVMGRENLLHVARSYNALSEVYREQGKYDLAEHDCLQALEIREHELDTTHRNVISSIGNLANIYVDWGKYAQAQELFEKALAIRLKTQRPDLPRLTTILSHQAKLYVEQGKYNQAESFYKQALELYTKFFDEQHPEVLDVINSLGSLYILQRKYIQAESYLNRAREGRLLVLGMNHPQLGQSYNSQGSLYHALNRYDVAENLYRQALAILEQALGAEHPYVAQTHYKLGLLYSDQERYTTAQPLLALSLTLRQKVLGPEHPHVAQSLNDLAKVYFMQSNFTSAKKLYEEALNIDEHVFGPINPHLATVLINYAALLRRRRSHATAKKLEDRARIIQSKLAQENF